MCSLGQVASDADGVESGKVINIQGDRRHVVNQLNCKEQEVDTQRVHFGE